MDRREGEMRASGVQNGEENHAHQVRKEFWVFNEEHEEDICDGSRSFESSSMENSMSSMESSSSSSDLVEDAFSSSSTSSSSGPLYELSDLMMHLPIK